MRRTHPQRARVPGLQQNVNHLSSIGTSSKQWTTVSDIRNNAHNRHSDSGNSKTNPRPFSFQSNLNQKPSQSYTNEHSKLEDDISELLNDSDDDFEEPGRPGQPSKHHGVRRHQLSLEDGGSNSTTPNEDKPAPKRQRRPSPIESDHFLDGAWPSSPSLDLDFTQDVISPRIKKATLSTYSAVSATQHALDEIDEFLLEDSVPMSPVHSLDAPDESNNSDNSKSLEETTARRGSAPAEVPAATTVSKECVEADGHQDQDSRDRTPLETSKDTNTKDNEQTMTTVKNDPVSSREVGQDQTQGLAQPPQVFDVPATTPDFRSRLEEMKVKFQSSMDDMMEAIRSVDSLKSFIEDALSRQQGYLDERGKHIQHQVQNLQKEATTLHSKATKGLD
ncbi:hypothetical protein BGX34_008733 [Mortierella sp. NVP85]|nr:hypothetical protein BGX34_008733 [Mortierella sp. NVP85]